MSDHKLGGQLQLCRGVRVVLQSWFEDSNIPNWTLPVGSCSRLVKTLGQAGEIEPETEGILLEYEVDFSEFSDEVLDCLPNNLPWTIPPEEIRKRRDLRYSYWLSTFRFYWFTQKLIVLNEALIKIVDMFDKQCYFSVGKSVSSQSILQQPEI